MTLIHAFALFVSFLGSFFLVKQFSQQFGFLQWCLAIFIGFILFGAYVGVRAIWFLKKQKHSERNKH